MHDLTKLFKEDYSWKEFTNNSEFDSRCNEFTQNDQCEVEPSVIKVTANYIKTRFQDVSQIYQHLHEMAKGYGV